MVSATSEYCLDRCEPQTSEENLLHNAFSDIAVLTEIGDIQTRINVHDQTKILGNSPVLIVQNHPSEGCMENIAGFPQSHLGHQAVIREGCDKEVEMDRPDSDNGALDRNSPNSSKPAPFVREALSDADLMRNRSDMSIARISSMLTQAQGDRGVKPEDLPPRGSPLHLQIQAYALRWGYWAAMIENGERREEVLKWVTNQMRHAWEMAIREQYYSTTIDDLQATGIAMSPKERHGTENIKRIKKRAISPSKQPAGFVYEGKDMYAVTNGELENAGITMEMVNQRVESHNLTDAELLFDEVLTNLNRNIGIRDWSVNQYAPMVHGRNLLMFCLYTVQESRSNIDRLEWLHGQFTRDIQKRNTQKRIDLHRQRVDQHLALAAELNLRQKNAIESEHESSEESQISLVPSLLQPDRGSGSRDDWQEREADQSQQDSSRRVRGIDQNLMVEVANDVLGAGNQTMLQMAFRSRNITEGSFEEDTTMEFSGDEDFLQLKKTLGEIFQQITWIHAMKQHSLQREDPKEKIKIGHEIQLSKAKIEKSRELLRSVLNKVLSIKNNDEDFTNTNTSQDPVKLHQPNQATFATGFTDAEADHRDDSPEVLRGSSDMLQNASQPSKKRLRYEGDDYELPESKRAKIVAEHRSTCSSTLKDAKAQFINDKGDQSAIVGDVSKDPFEANQSQHLESFLQSSAEVEAAAKQVYTDEVWLPKINQLLQNAGQPPLQGVLSKWKGIKDILTYLGYSIESRNQFLRTFRDGYTDWCKQHGDNRQDSESLTLQQCQFFQRLWPNKDEVIALVGKQGIMVQFLISFYSDRCKGQEQEFLDWVKGFTQYDSNKEMIYPLRNTLIHQWQNDVVNAQTFSKDNNAPGNEQIQNVENLQDCATNVISLKLHVPKHHRDSFVVKLKAGKSHDFGEYSSHLPNISQKQGFVFRFMPYATMKQRQRLDELITDYATKIIQERSRSARPYGEYVQFVDPRESDGGAVAHGFWNLKNGDRPKGSEWFYNGDEKPEGWDVQVYENREQLAASVDDLDTSSQHQRHTKLTTSKGNKPSAGNKKAQGTNVKKTKNRRIVNEHGEDSDSEYNPLA